MTYPAITISYLPYFVLLFVAFSVTVVVYRGKLDVVFGDGGHAPLLSIGWPVSCSSHAYFMPSACRRMPGRSDTSSSGPVV